MEEPEYKSTKEIRTIDRVTQNEVIYFKAVITLPELRDDICKHGNTNNGYVAAATRPHFSNVCSYFCSCCH